VQARILPGAPSEQHRILFSVVDTGIGIAGDEQAQLFTPFVQVDGGYARGHQGAGLGLSICRRLVELMGGSITLASEPGAGTTISFVLDFAVDTEPFTPSPVADEAVVSLTGRRILLAEDDPVSALASSAMLRKQGAEVTHVEDGWAVLDALAQAAFDVLLLDVQMPVLDGVATTHAIRAGQAGEAARDIPIIAMTAYAMAGDKDNFLSAGMNAYVAKPMSLKELLGAIGGVLGR
jgi:CheY-like chemotaxis protein